MYFMGIDWANEKHNICVLNQDGKIVREFIITNDQRGFDILRKRIERLHDEVHINIERADGLLVDWLVRNGHLVYLTPPMSLHHRRPRRTKSDQGDAYLLDHLLRIGDEECRPLARRSDLIEYLRQLLRMYDMMVQEQRRLGNRLIYLLRQYYPAALQLFCQPYRLIALNWLERYPNPDQALTASVTDIQNFLRENRYFHSKIDKKASDMYTILQTPSPRAQVENGYIYSLQLLIPMLRHVYKSRNEIRRKIYQAVPNHPDTEWWQTIPGAQNLTGARLLAWIGDDRERFPTANTLQATAGTVPVTRRSGKSRSVEFRHACSHKLRKTVDDLARQSVKKSVWAREYYDEQIRRGHGSARAYRALGNRWLSIIWKLWQTRTKYDEALHMANRRKNASRSELKKAG